jgi:adenine phosphoribosyltransferase
VAARLELPFVPVRKPGKLPIPALSIDYALEYGSDTLEIDPGAIESEQRVVVIDDLIATGGRLWRRCSCCVRRAGWSAMRCL